MTDTSTIVDKLEKLKGSKAVQPVSNKALNPGMNKAVPPSYNKGISNGST